MKSTVFLDIDGVICNWVDKTLEFHAKDYPHDQIHPLNDYAIYNSVFHSEEMKKRFIEHSENGGYYDLAMSLSNPYPLALAGYRALQERYDIVFITSRPEWARDLTIKWLGLHNFNNYKELILTEHGLKGPIIKSSSYFDSTSFLIDDSPAQLVSFFNTTGQLPLCINRPWNQEIRTKNYRHPYEDDMIQNFPRTNSILDFMNNLKI